MRKLILPRRLDNTVRLPQIASADARESDDSRAQCRTVVIMARCKDARLARAVNDVAASCAVEDSDEHFAETMRGRCSGVCGAVFRGLLVVEQHAGERCEYGEGARGSTGTRNRQDGLLADGHSRSELGKRRRAAFGYGSRSHGVHERRGQSGHVGGDIRFAEPAFATG